MDERRLRTLMRAFITSHFQYCPLISMFHSRQLNNKINKIQERALRITYKDTEHNASNSELSEDYAITIHTRTCNYLWLRCTKLKMA